MVEPATLDLQSDRLSTALWTGFLATRFIIILGRVIGNVLHPRNLSRDFVFRLKHSPPLYHTKRCGGRWGRERGRAAAGSDCFRHNGLIQ